MRSPLRWLRDLACQWRGHPTTTPHRTFQVNGLGLVSAVETWKSCHCGKVASGCSRATYREPYPIHEVARRRKR